MISLRCVRLATALSLAFSVLVCRSNAGELRWAYDSPGQQWLPREVSLGDRGTQTLMAVGPFGGFTRCFSSFDASQPAPIWQRLESVSMYNPRVASAEFAAVHATLHDEQAGSSSLHNVYVRKYTSDSPQPDWTFTFPFQTNGHDRTALMMSHDGERIVAVVDDIWTSTESVVVLGRNSNVPLRTVAVPLVGAFVDVRLSADARRLYMASSLRVVIIDLDQGTVLFSLPIFDQMYGRPAISANGDVFAFGTQFAYKVYRWVGGTYQLAFTRPALSPLLAGKLDISDDGSTLAAALDDRVNFQTVIVEALDLPASLNAGQPVTTDTYTVTSASTLNNLESGLEVSADGRRIAVGLWGDGGGPSPEVVVFQRGNSTPILTQDLPGSVMDIDFSSDGRWLVVGSKSQHYNVFGGGGRVSLFSVGTGDCRVAGVPHLGGSVTVRVAGPAGSGAAALIASEPAVLPTMFPNVGTLYLRRTLVSPLAMPDCDANGFSSVVLPLPASTYSLGQTFYVQGLRSVPRRLTDDWATLTIVP